MELEHIVFAIALLWGFISFIWILVQHFSLATYKEDFRNYRLIQQKSMCLYIEASRRNRKLVDQNKNLKNAIAHTIFYSEGWTLEMTTNWYKQFNISVTDAVEEGESSTDEVIHFIKQDKDAANYYKNALG